MFRVFFATMVLVVFFSANNVYAFSLLDSLFNLNKIGDETTLPGTNIKLCYTECTVSHCSGLVDQATNGGAFWATCGYESPPPFTPPSSSGSSGGVSIPSIPGVSGLIGGMAGKIITCDEGLWMPTVSGPVGGPKMWLLGTLSYMFGPPSFPAQWLLGVTAAESPCTVSGEIIGYGDAIEFHGSSGVGGGGGLGGGMPAPLIPSTGQPATKEDCNGGAIPTKGGESTAQCSPALVQNLNNFCAQFGKGFEVTEGCANEYASPTECRAAQAKDSSILCHSNQCHYDGTCVDIAFPSSEDAKMFSCAADMKRADCTASDYGLQKIKDGYAAAQANGDRVVFEVRSDQTALKAQLDAAGIPYKAYSHVTAPHFSYYCRNCGG
ncbi:MAG: hypothetical protein AAB573_02355 [Patescibacteria group bacterium]